MPGLMEQTRQVLEAFRIAETQDAAFVDDRPVIPFPPAERSYGRKRARQGAEETVTVTGLGDGFGQGRVGPSLLSFPTL